MALERGFKCGQPFPQVWTAVPQVVQRLSAIGFDFVSDFIFFEFGKKFPVNQIPVDVRDTRKLQGNDAKFIRLGVVGVVGLRRLP